MQNYPYKQSSHISIICTTGFQFKSINEITLRSAVEITTTPTQACTTTFIPLLPVQFNPKVPCYQYDAVVAIVYCVTAVLMTASFLCVYPVHSTTCTNQKR